MARQSISRLPPVFHQAFMTIYNIYDNICHTTLLDKPSDVKSWKVLNFRVKFIVLQLCWW